MTSTETDGEFLARVGTDGALWAAAFAEKFGGDPTPGGELHAWLANAIEAGRGAGYSQAKREHLPNWPLSEPVPGDHA